MRNRRFAALAGVAAVCAALAPAAEAAPRAATVTPEKKAEWTGAPGPGLNISFFNPTARTPATCNGVDAQFMCDETLVHFDTAKEFTDATLKFRMDGFQAADFDLRVYESDATGEPLNYLGSPESDNSKTSPAGANDPRNTFLGDGEEKTVVDPLPDSYYLVQVVYFTVPPGQTYNGAATFTGTPAG